MVLFPLAETEEGSSAVNIYKFGENREVELCYIIEEAFPDVKLSGLVVNASSRISSIEEFSGELTDASYRTAQGFAHAFLHISTHPYTLKISSKSHLLNEEIKETLVATRCPDKYKRPTLGSGNTLCTK